MWPATRYARSSSMSRIAEKPLSRSAAGKIAAVRYAREKRIPFFGICLGLQLLFDGSDEDGAVTLGILPGRTVRLTGAPTLPHIGWNQVERTRPHDLFDGIDAGADYNFSADARVRADTASALVGP